MRSTTFSLLAFLLSILLLSTGCDKGGDDTAEPSNGNGLNLGGGGSGGGGGGGGGQTPAQLLCDRNYTLTASTVSPAYQGTTDLFSSLPSCNTDDILRFAQAGTWTLDEGPTMCSQGGQQTYSGNWSLGQNNTVLALTGAFQVTWTVVTIDGNVLRVRSEQTADGQTYTVTDTWTKQ